MNITKKNNYLTNEICAINNLIQCSKIKKGEKREKEISIKDWDAVCSWEQTTPMCSYTNKSQSKKKRKKGSSKKKTRDPFSPVGRRQQEQHQDQEKSFEKCIPSKAGLFDRVTKDTKNDQRQYETPLLKETNCEESCKANNGFTRTENKLSRSTNVLSYESPSWRFLFDNKDFGYVERISPKNRVYNFLKRTKSSNSKYSSTKQILDPAGFIDEQIVIAYKNSKDFHPNQELRSLMSQINNPDTHDFETMDLQKRLYVTSCIKKLLSFGECEIVKHGHPFVKNSPSQFGKTSKTFKKNKTIKHKSKKGKTVPKTSKYQQHCNSTCLLPKIGLKQQRPTTTKLTESSSFYHRSTSPPLINFQTEELYMPLLHHSNLTSKLQYLKRPEVKLPDVAGIKISLSSTSNSGLVL